MSNSVLPLELGRSQKKLFSAFIELRKEKSTEKITVVELCQKAGVNRSTFYRSYYDIFDLEEKIDEYCANAVLSFCADFCYGYSEGLADAHSVLTIPKFDNAFAADALFVLQNERLLWKNIFERLMSVFSVFIPEGCLKSDEERLRIAYQFIITGAIRVCGEAEGENSADIIYEASKIAFYLFKNCIDLVKSGSDPETPPIAENEEMNLPPKKERLNVKKTKRSLKRAFAELIKKKPVEKITVSELCEKAEICNSTFYTHYNSIEAFVASLNEDMMNTFLDIAQGIYAQMGNDKLNVKELMTYIEKNQALCKLLTSNETLQTLDCSYPHEFTNAFFEIVDKDFDCPLFENRIAFDLVCHSAWGMLFDTFCESDISPSSVIMIAYDIFLLLFKHRDEQA